MERRRRYLLFETGIFLPSYDFIGTVRKEKRTESINDQFF
jgi:hypothetical protein